MSTSMLRKVVLVMGVVSAVLGSNVGSAAADDDHWRHEQRDDREWQNRERWEHEREERRYVPPPVVYAPPPRVIYAPPPMVAEPPSGISIILPSINIR